jgi:predicted small secreted protein
MKYIRNSALLALIFLSLGLSACETIDGAGRDIENAGEAVQKSSH